VAADPEKAARWYRRAAEQGHRDARVNLGRLRAEGRGVDRDHERAVALWRRAARQGHPVAQYNLGLAYRNGRGVPRDGRRAAHWLRRAAHQGLAAAQAALGGFYRDGGVLPHDPGRALAWFARAAERGHTRAADAARRLRERGVRPGSLPAASPAHGGGRPKAASYALWLGSARTRAGARAVWRTLHRRLGERVLAELRLRLRTVGGGPNGARGDAPVTRVLAGRFAEAGAARMACRRLTETDRTLFCQVVESNS